jgi:hypothetical protein
VLLIVLNPAISNGSPPWLAETLFHETACIVLAMGDGAGTLKKLLPNNKVAIRWCLHGSIICWCKPT